MHVVIFVISANLYSEDTDGSIISKLRQNVKIAAQKRINNFFTFIIGNTFQNMYPY